MVLVPSAQAGVHQHAASPLLTRRALLGAGAGAAAGAVVLGAHPASADARPPRDRLPDSYPKPVPGGTPVPEPLGTGETYHFFLPGPGNDPSAITDFRGAVGLSVVRGEGTATNTETGDTERVVYEIDVRFMRGTYVGDDGRRESATIGFL
jgi:hypothetical protein